MVDQSRRVLTGEQLSEVRHKRHKGTKAQRTKDKGTKVQRDKGTNVCWPFKALREKKRAQTLPSPLWKDRSGGLPGTALSIPAPGESYGSLPKRRTLDLGFARALRVQMFSSSNLSRYRLVEAVSAGRFDQTLNYLGYLR